MEKVKGESLWIKARKIFRLGSVPQLQHRPVKIRLQLEEIWGQERKRQHWAPIRSLMNTVSPPLLGLIETQCCRPYISLLFLRLFKARQSFLFSFHYCSILFNLCVCASLFLFCFVMRHIPTAVNKPFKNRHPKHVYYVVWKHVIVHNPQQAIMA